jgi:hypothetical protein
MLGENLFRDLDALGPAGYGIKVLLANGNYPFSPGANP